MDDKEKRLEELEAMMSSPDFWLDKEKAQAFVQEYQKLKEGPPTGGGDGHDAGNATLAILSGAGG